MLDGFEQGLRTLWPAAPKATVAALVDNCDAVFADYEIDTPLRIAHFMAQISHECGAGTIVRESGNYKPERVLEIFGAGKSSAAVKPEEVAALAHNPQALFERVYNLPNSPKLAKELGNHLPGDGYRYRGNGMLQLTGRASHKHIGDLTGFNLEDDPEQLQNPAISFRVAAAEFKALNCLEAADADDIVKVTLRVNGGRNGLAERTVWLRKWKRVLDGIEEPAQTPRAAAQPKTTILKTKIAQGAIGGGAVTTVVAAGQIAQTLKTVSDASETAKQITDNTTAVVNATKPMFALPLSILLSLLAIGAVAAFAYVFWKRYQKLRDEGV